MKLPIAMALLVAALVAPWARADRAPAVIIALRDEVDDYNRDQFIRRFDAARAAGAKTVIVEINTYGGLVTAGLDLSRYLKNQSGVHTVAYVNTKAISAGAMIAMACDEIVMADDAAIGDCAPITVSNGQMTPMPAAERAKAESPIVADFYDSAIRNHHDPLLAEAMVSVASVVYWVEGPGGARRFVNQADYDRLTGAGWKPVDGAPNPVDPADRLLTVHTALAVKLGLAAGTAPSAEQLAADRQLNVTAIYRPGWGEALVAWLNSGFVRMSLLTIFAVSLYAALHAPGHGSSEAIAMISGGLLLGVPLLAGYATWWEIAMIVGGLALVAFEIFVFPHAGVMIVAGIGLMAVGLMLTFVGAEPSGTPGVLPRLSGTWTSLEHALLYVVGGSTASLLLCWWLSRFLGDLPYLNRLVLSGTAATVNAAATATPPAARWQPLVGTVGRAVVPLRPGGVAEFTDDIFAARHVVTVTSEGGYVDAGTEVVVRQVAGSRVVVRPI